MIHSSGTKYNLKFCGFIKIKNGGTNIDIKL